MAVMKKLYNLNETQELMDYFGELVAWDGILELVRQSRDNPTGQHFLLSKGAILKVVDRDSLIRHVADGWHCELDCRVLFDNGIVQNSEQQ